MKTAKYFTASWCGPCKAFKPIIEELIEEGQPIEILDVDEYQELAAYFNILSVPTTIILEDDKLFRGRTLLLCRCQGSTRC